GDFNGDGFADVLVRSTDTTSPHQLYYANMQNGQNAGWVAASDALSSDWQVHGVGDVNSGGFAGIMLQHQRTSQIAYVAEHATSYDHQANIVNPGIHWHEV